MWDDLPEEKRELLLHYDAEVCSECGNLRSECSDPETDWHPRTDVCWATASRQWAEGVLRKRHEKDEPAEDELPYLAGRFVWVSTVPPPEGEDEFAG